jgi:hypothetical protein
MLHLGLSCTLKFRIFMFLLLPLSQHAFEGASAGLPR